MLPVELDLAAWFLCPLESCSRCAKGDLTPRWVVIRSMSVCRCSPSVALNDEVAGRVGPCRLVPLSSQVKLKVRERLSHSMIDEHVVDVRAVFTSRWMTKLPVELDHAAWFLCPLKSGSRCAQGYLTA